MIFRAPEPPVVVPEVALTPFLLERATERGEQAALIEGPTGRALSFRAWAEAVRATAAGLARRGFRQGDVFAVYSHNLPEYAVAFHAVSLLGGVVTTINPLYTAGELGHQLHDAGARYLVTAPPFVERARQAMAEQGSEELFVFGEADGATPFAELAAHGGEPPPVRIEPRQDLVALPYSSGTTGLPKGVMLTHHNLVANVLQAGAVLAVREGDVVLGVLPFFHIYGMEVIMNLALHVGATVVTMPRFELDQCLQVMQDYRVTFANVVPPILLALAKSPQVGSYDLSRLRTLFSGAAPLGAAVAAAVSERLGCEVIQGYGLTETSPVTHAARAGSGGPAAVGIGPPVPGTEVKVVDVDSGAALGPGKEGEICIRGPQVMKGYLNRPDATAAMIDVEGWLHTGDIGYADPAGCFFVVDRVKELIKYKGMQVAPAELEAVLLAHPAVADAAVVPLEDDEAGQIPKAFLVLRDPQASTDEILGFVAARVAPHKRLRAVELIDQIPKSASGKILRRVLRERQRAASVADDRAQGQLAKASVSATRAAGRPSGLS